MVRSSRLVPVLLVFAALTWAQEKHGTIQVQKYTIDAEINPRTQSITATAKIDFTPLDNINDATFELNNALTVSKAVDGLGKPLATSRSTQDFTIHVSFPNGLAKSQPCQVSLSYDGKLTGNEDSPVSGIKFAALHPDYGYLLYPARWFPVSGYT
ncbi:MAG: peptidase M1, partial [Acidobacteriaceae bacterium]|nr:peptidase M1 [Acidobacteriaceae bacterium]